MKYIYISNIMSIENKPCKETSINTGEDKPILAEGDGYESKKQKQKQKKQRKQTFVGAFGYRLLFCFVFSKNQGRMAAILAAAVVQHYFSLRRT